MFEKFRYLGKKQNAQNRQTLVNRSSFHRPIPLHHHSCPPAQTSPAPSLKNPRIQAVMTNTFHQPHSLPAQPICQMGPQGVPQGLQAIGPSGPGGAGPTSLQGHVLHHHQDHVQVWSLFFSTCGSAPDIQIIISGFFNKHTIKVYVGFS